MKNTIWDSRNASNSEAISKWGLRKEMEIMQRDCFGRASLAMTRPSEDGTRQKQVGEEHELGIRVIASDSEAISKWGLRKEMKWGESDCFGGKLPPLSSGEGKGVRF